MYTDADYRKTEKYREAQKRYRATEKCKLAFHNHHLLHRYGITLAEKQRMYVEQNGLCGLCTEPLPVDIKKAHLDHSHRSGKIRKLLCHRCNLLVGFLEKDLSLTGKALQYLLEHS